MTINSRAKGARFEREVVDDIRAAGWPNARRTSDGREQKGRGDIANGPANVHIECKFRERLNVAAAFDQIVEDAGPLDMPVLVHRPLRHATMATLPLDDLLALLAFKEFS